MTTFKIVRGFSVRIQINLVGIDPDTKVEFPYPLVNRTVLSVAKPSAHSCQSYAFDINILDAANGLLELSMSPSLTSTIESDNLVFDIRVSDDHDPDWSFRALQGNISVENEITPA